MTSPDPETPPSRRLTRSADDRMIAGVAGGLARHFDLDPSLVRIGLVVLALFGGLGLAIYAVAALVVPNEDGAPSLSTGAKIAIGVIGGIALLSFPFTGFIVAPGIAAVAVLGALGIVVWRAAGGRPDSRVMRASLIVLAVCGSAALGIGAGTAAAFGAGEVVAIIAIGVGAALVVAGLFGGARWLIVPALLLALPVSVVSAADLELEGGAGDRVYRPASVSEIRAEYRLGVGELELDLSDVAIEPGQDVEVAVRIGFGEATVIAPPGVCVVTEAHAGMGAIELFGRLSEGVDVDAERGAPEDLETPTLRLDLHAGAGELRVDRAGAGGDGC